MMLHVTLFILVVAVIWFVMGFYWRYAVRPFLQDVARFQVFKVRDELRNSAIAREVNPESFSYGFLERMLNNMVHSCSWFSFSVLIEYMVFHGVKETEAMKKFDREASPELKRFEETALRAVAPAVMANSLGWTCVGIACYAVSRVRAYFIEKLANRSRVFWHDEQAIMSHAR
jgi:hypothetical protein